MRKAHEVFRTADGVTVYYGSYESCKRFMHKSNGYFWLMIRQAN